jgi:hypothetical protein
MQVTFDVKPELEAALAAQAEARGVPVRTWVASVVEERLAHPPRQLRSEEVLNAVEKMKRLSEGNRLDGLKIKDLMQEGRR